MKIAHSPTPWKVGDRKPYVEVWGPMRMNSSPILASMDSEPREANAALIIKAVNNHDALVKALELQEAAETANMNCDECDPEDAPETCAKCFPLYDDARVARRAALANLKCAEA